MSLLSTGNIIKNLSLAGVTYSPAIGRDTGVASAPTVTVQSPLNNLDKELKKLEEKYRLYGKNAYDLPDTLNAEPMEYKGMTEEQINEYAKAQMAAEYAAALRSINDDAKRSKNDLTTYKDKLNAAAGDGMTAADEAYKQAARVTSDDALKRGLSRSSIIVNKLANLEEKKTETKADISSKLFKDLADIDNGLDSLETKRLRSVDELDLVNAAKLAQEIKNLTERREKQLDEILKYNNSLREKQADYALQYAKTDSALDKDAYDKVANDIKNGLSVEINAQIQQEKYAKINEFLNGAGKQDAVNYLKNNEEYFTRQVGAAYYQKLLSEQQAR
ncbi:hypothetical protein FACS1894211_04330 [Clostridia bacterium]|nr:hypothetical protein FACS1894211_04330 [Clostridia bacterium]